MRAVFVYSLDGHKATQVTDGMSDAIIPVFDKNGKYLYFTASTNSGTHDGLARHDERGSSRHAQRLRRRAEPRICHRRSLRRATKRSRRKRRRMTNADAPVPTPKRRRPKRARRSRSPSTSDRLRRPRPAHSRAADSGAQLRGLVRRQRRRSLSGRRPSGRRRARPAHATVQRFELKTRKTEKLVDNVEAFELSATARRCSTARATLVHQSGREAARGRQRHAEDWTQWKSTSFHAQNGSRCTTKCGASSATSSTTLTCTGSTCRRPSKCTSPFWRASPAAPI